MSLSNVASLAHIGPEVVLVVTIVAVLLAELILRGRYVWTGAIALLGTLLALWIAAQPVPDTPMQLFEGMMALDPFTRFFRVVVLLATGIGVILGLDSQEIRPGERSEFFALVLATSLGAMFLASATDVLMIYLSLETVSVLSYVLACYVRGSRRSAEAGLKYVIYGGVASGIMIYGLSLLYGLAGSTSVAAIHEVVATTPGAVPTALMGLVLSLAGFGYKIAAVPFHMWAPDVYEGVSTAVTAFFSVVPKAGGFAALVRFFVTGFAVSGPAVGAWTPVVGMSYWPGLLVAVCVASMIVGNLAALPQRNVKRLLAYSSIAHAGFILMGLTVLTANGLSAMLVYLAVYLFMNLGAFLCVLMVVNALGSDDLDAFRGLFWRGRQAAFVASLAVVFLVALAGLPPTGGFIAKLEVFKAVVEKGVIWLALVGLVNAVVSLYYYARVMRAMFMEGEAEVAGHEALRFNPIHLGLAAALAVPTVVLGIFFGPLVQIAQRSIELFGG